MNPVFIVVKTNGEIWVVNRKEDAAAMTSVAVRFKLDVLPIPGGSVKVGTISGTNPYSVSASAPTEHGNKLADTF